MDFTIRFEVDDSEECSFDGYLELIGTAGSAIASDRATIEAAGQPCDGAASKKAGGYAQEKQPEIRNVFGNLAEAMHYDKKHDDATYQSDGVGFHVGVKADEFVAVDADVEVVGSGACHVGKLH